MPAEHVLVYDDHGDHQALSCARTLAERGAKVTLATPDRMVGEEVGLSNIDPYLSAFDSLGINVIADVRLRKIESQSGGYSVVLRHEFSGNDRIVETGAIVIEHGVLPLDELYLSLKDQSWNGGETAPSALVEGTLREAAPSKTEAIELHRIGDAVSSRNIHAAIHDALRLCVQL
ncbi:MAG: hypothetical protein HOI95_00540 [Chromatiales bacterium]|nr:hypothetical protein [Chromatiales bacterium]